MTDVVTAHPPPARHRGQPATTRRRRRRCEGRFAFSSDVWADGMLWGATLRSPHPYARIVRIDPSPAWRIPGVEAVVTADDVPGLPTYGLIAAGPAGVRLRRRPLRRGARRGGRRRPPRDVPAGAGRHRRRVRGARPPARSRGRGSGGHEPIHPGGNVLRHQRIVRGDAGGHRSRRRRGHLRDRHAGPGLPRPRGGDGAARHRRHGRRALHLDAVAARGPPADRGLPRPAAGEGAPDPRRRRRRVRRAGGHQPAGALLPARPAHGAAGEDAVRPGRVLLRPRAPPPGPHLDAPSRHRRRPHREDRGPLRARRRRLRVDVVGRAASTPSPTCRARTSARTPSSTVGRCAPTTRRAGRCAGSAWSRRASPTRARWTSWRRRAGSTRSRSACGTRSHRATG